MQTLMYKIQRQPFHKHFIDDTFLFIGNSFLDLCLFYILIDNICKHFYSTFLGYFFLSHFLDADPLLFFKYFKASC